MGMFSFFLISCFAFVLAPVAAFAGPPFKTDDPEPVEYKHWEVYLASQGSLDRDTRSLTAPHVEINYGVFPNPTFAIQRFCGRKCLILRS